MTRVQTCLVETTSTTEGILLFILQEIDFFEDNVLILDPYYRINLLNLILIKITTLFKADERDAS